MDKGSPGCAELDGFHTTIVSVFVSMTLGECLDFLSLGFLDFLLHLIPILLHMSRQY